MAIIEIRDPALEQEKIPQRVQASVEHRLAQGGYGPDPARLGPESLRSTPVEAPELSVSEFPGLDEALLSLAAHTSLSETQFTSGVPVIGPVIVVVRRWWNWMSTKWYVLPILHQQSHINAHVSIILDNLAHWQLFNATALAQLQARVIELEARLEKLEKR